MAQFSDKGSHCMAPYCGQLDFLPFTCEFCTDVFCLDHFKPESHACRNSQLIDRDKKVIVCPICSKAIKILPGQQEQRLWEDHARSGLCEPAQFSANGEPKKKRCPVKGCRAQLTAVNSYQCKKCTQVLCLKHRLDMDHECSPPPKVKGTWSSFLGGSSTTTTGKGPAVTATTSSTAGHHQPRRGNSSVMDALRGWWRKGSSSSSSSTRRRGAV